MPQMRRETLIRLDRKILMSGVFLASGFSIFHALLPGLPITHKAPKTVRFLLSDFFKIKYNGGDIRGGTNT